MFCIRTLINQIEKRPQNLILFIRHAEKALVDDIDDFNLELTQNGIKETQRLAHYLRQKFKSIEIKTSPVKRCLQTAEIMAAGFGQPLEAIGFSHLLGNPGAYVQDAKKAALTFQQYTIYEVVQNQLKGQLMPGMRDIQEGSELLLQEMKTDLESACQPIIYISHDVIMAAFIGSLFHDVGFSQQTWIPYLNGFCIKKINHTMHLYTATHCYPITRK